MTSAETRRPLAPVREDLGELSGYHSPQVDVEVRLNTNESPLPPPPEWVEELRDELSGIAFNRYPDRDAVSLRRALCDLHDVGLQEVFCAKGSNEVLQCLLLAYGGPGRTAALFEPTYALHGHISHITGTTVASSWRNSDHAIDIAAAKDLLERERPVITFLCSPNNPTGRSEPEEVVAAMLEVVDDIGGLLVVDEAYGQFARSSALDLRGRGAQGGRLVVVRTFSKTWSMAACRLGYMVADEEVVAACEKVALPYHIDAVTQAAGRLALGHVNDMEKRVASITEERGRVMAALAELPVQYWPSDANFVLFRPVDRPAGEVWSDLLAQSVLVRDCSRWRGLKECLRVTVGTPPENERFLTALRSSLEPPTRKDGRL